MSTALWTLEPAVNLRKRLSDVHGGEPLDRIQDE
jgi:hypothetical protein